MNVKWEKGSVEMRIAVYNKSSERDKKQADTHWREEGREGERAREREGGRHYLSACLGLNLLDCPPFLPNQEPNEMGRAIHADGLTRKGGREGGREGGM